MPKHRDHPGHETASPTPSEAPEPTGTRGRVGAVDRRRRVLVAVRAEGSMRVRDLAARLGVSEETVRRDLTALETQGVLIRQHGRALPVEAGNFETTMTRRSGQFVAEKRRIAAAAAQRLAEAETIFLDEGYTPSLVASMIPTDRPHSFVTTSLPTASALATIPQFTVYLAGGRVRGSTMGCVDHWTVDMISGFRFDAAVIGANGISLANGLTTPDPAVAAVKQVAMENSRSSVFVGIHTKFGVTSFARFGSVDDLDAVVTDRHLPAHIADRFKIVGPQVLRV